MSGDSPQTHVTHSTTLSSLSSSPVTVIIVTISVRRELPGELDLLEVSHVLPGEGEEPEDPAGHLGDGEGPRDVAGSLEQERTLKLFLWLDNGLKRRLKMNSEYTKKLSELMVMI